MVARRLHLALGLAVLVGCGAYAAPKVAFAWAGLHQRTYGAPQQYVSYFGGSVLHEAGWDRYLLYTAINGAVVAGKPGNTTPGDAGTFNAVCNTWWADRIWLTWHFGDGLTPSGWDAPDGAGNVPPFLLLSNGGAGESALIGDPVVVSWQNQWHMYYEGTDDCGGIGNKIFHATASSWFGPWAKQGEVVGLTGNAGGSGYSWPTTLVDGATLALYYTDGNVRLLAAHATDATGHVFAMDNGGNPVSPSMINRGHVTKAGSTYTLTADNFGQTQITQVTSSNRLKFKAGTLVFGPDASGWDSQHVGLPFALPSENRIYYTGAGTSERRIGVYQ